MTPRERVRRAQRRLAGAVVVAALLWAATLAMAVVDLAAVIDALVPLPAVVRASIAPLMLLAAVAVAGIVLWRGRTARSIEHVALWIEEHEPTLRYALVTATDSRIAPAEQHRDLHALANAADVEGIVRHAWHRTIGWALVSAVIAAGVLGILQPKDLLRAAERDLARRSAPNPPAPMPNRLTALSARVDPPAYSRLPAETLDQPANVEALIGSRVTFVGKGPPGGVTATVGADGLGATIDRHGWAVQLMMPKEPTVVTLRDRAYKRLVVLEPRTDSAPNIRLVLPVHDTTYQTVPKGRLVVEATLTDDIGVAYGNFEYLLSTGSQETFDTKSMTGPRVAFGAARAATLRDVIDLDTMKLAPGSVLHIRAVAFDFNDVTGPGKGLSETRTLRIAEPIDSTSINAAPPLPIDSMWVSQRLLNMKTDTLIRSKRKLDHEEFVHRSSGYSNSQEDIRKRALAVVALLEDNGVGGSFETEASKVLREAADLMWTAREHLAVAEPDSAMPYMKRILKILDDLRLAHRYYLRGLLKPVAVNIERVRMTGKDTAAAVTRKARAGLSDPNAALAARIGVAAALARTTPMAAVDSLTYIRVTALTTAPAVANALRKAIEMLEKGASVDNALARARRALEPKPVILGGPAEWGGVMP
jgi:type IV secretory pathway VirB2 component (pilin)